MVFIVIIYVVSSGILVAHCLFGAQAVPRDQNEKVPPILFGQDGVQKWIRTRVEGIKGDQKKFRLRHINQWIASNSSQSEESDRSPTGKVGKYKHCHSFSNGNVIHGGTSLLTYDRNIHLSMKQ